MIRRFAPVLILLAQVVLFYRLVLFSDRVIPWDLGGFHLPHAYAYSDVLRHGKLPLWDPYTYCGRPFQANIQTAVFYPSVALVAAVGAILGQQHLFYLLELNVILHVFLAGFFTWWLALSLGWSLPSSLIAATAYQLGGFFAAHAQHMGSVMAAAWLPFVLLCVVRGEKGSRLRWGLLLSASLCLSLLAGFTPLSAIVWASGALFLVLRRGGWVGLAWYGACCLGALALAAAQLLPSLELNRLSIAPLRTEWLGAGGGIPLAALVSLVLPNYFGVFDPSTYRYPYELTFMYLYSGLLPLVLAVCPAARPRKNWTWIAFLLAGALAMHGDATPVGRSAYVLLPKSVRAALHPEFAMPVFLLALALLAAAGAEQVLRRPLWRWIAMILCAADLILVSSGRPMNATPAPEGVNSRARLDGRPETLPRLRTLAGRSQPPARFDSLSGGAIFAVSAPMFQLPNANGDDPMALARIIRTRLAFTKGDPWGRFYEAQDPASPVLDLMNVRFLISRVPLPEDAAARAALRLSGEMPGFYVYERLSALPRFWLVTRLRTAASPEEAFRMLRSSDFQPGREAVVEGWSGAPVESPGPPGQVRVLRYEPDLVDLEVSAPSPQFLSTGETHYPGWRAFIDGNAQPLFITNGAFRGLPVPAGTHQVRIEFRPRIFLAGLALSLAAWLLWWGLMLRESRRARVSAA